MSSQLLHQFPGRDIRHDHQAITARRHDARRVKLQIVHRALVGLDLLKYFTILEPPDDDVAIGQTTY